MKELILVEMIERKIYLIRGHKVMLDSDLAELYGVPTRRLNEQFKRNIARFPSDFMFQLSHEEAENLRSQFATSIQGMVAEDTFLTSLQSRVLLCYQVFSIANAPFR